MITSNLAVSAEETMRISSRTTPSRVQSLRDIYNARDSKISILYNDTIIDCDGVEPINADGRVMIPFRSALEGMGATVDFDDKTRLVTAKKGDTTITFTLMDQTINVDESGKKYVVLMDTPMMLVNDSTLVPIRFMSNALGMQIGWDGDSQTVLIFDVDNYIDELCEVAPNFSSFLESNTPTYNSGYTDLDLKISLSGTDSKYDISLGGTYSDTLNDNVYTGDFAFDFAVNEDAIKNSEIKLIIKDETLYFKTDLANKLNNQTLMMVINNNDWYCINIKTLLEKIGMPSETVNMLLDVLTGQTANGLEMLKSAFDTENDTDFDAFIGFAILLDVYEQLDKLMTIEQDGEKTIVKMSVTSDDLLKMIISLFDTPVSDEEYNGVADMFEFNLDVLSEYDDKLSMGDMKFNVRYDDMFNINFELSQKKENDETVKTAEIPQEAVDLTHLIANLLG